jgi:hypothetical protein
MDNENAGINISEVFELVLLKPELFGAGTVIKLWCYIEGYKKALNDAGVSCDSSEFDEFCEWVEVRHSFLHTDNNYAEIILFSAFFEEQRAMMEMKSHWTKFKEERKTNQPGV